MRQVVNHGKKEKHQGVRHGCVAADTKRPVQTEQRQDSQTSTEHDVRRIERLLLQVAAAETPEAGPEINHSPQRHLYIQTAVCFNERQCLFELPVHIRRFAQLLVFPPFLLIVRRVVTRRAPVPEILIVAAIHLQAQTTAERNDLVECPVIPDEPGRRHQDERQYCRRYRRQPALPLFITPSANPRAQERRHRHHYRVDERTETGKQAKARPAPRSGRLQMQCRPENQAHEQSRQRCGPDEISGEVNRIWKECPYPSCPDRRPLPKMLSGDKVNRDASHGGEQAVQRQRCNR